MKAARKGEEQEHGTEDLRQNQIHQRLKKKKKSMQEENSIAPAQELLGLVRESQNMTRKEASRTRREWDSGLS